MDEQQRSDPQPALNPAAERLALVEVLDRDGHARLAVPVLRWPVRVGRAIDNDVVLDDTHVAAHHAKLDESAAGLSLQVGTTVNGARVGGKRLASGERAELAGGEAFQLGSTRLRVRRAADALAPEKALAPEPRGGWGLLAAMTVVLLAWNMAELWLNTDPGGRLSDYLPVLAGGPVALALWCGLWALGSKLFQHRFEFWPHVRVALVYLLAAGVVGLVLPLLAYALSWEFASRITDLAVGAVLTAMVLAHLSLVLPARKRLLAAATVAAFAAGVVVMLARSYQVNDRFFDELYMTTLAPPLLRVAPAVETRRFFEEAQDLKAVLDRHARDEDSAAPEFETDE